MIGILIVLIGTIIFLSILWNKKAYNYWKGRGIDQFKPFPIIGDISPVLTLKKSLGQLYEDLYFKSKDKKYIGFYELFKPCLLVNDVHLIENILVKDFSHFVNRDIPHLNPDKCEVDSGLPVLKDSEWRGVRYKLIPAFSSGKLKQMFQYMKNCSQNMLDYLELSPGKDVDIKDVTTVFALDAIASCAFGIDIKNDLGKNTQFREMGKKIFDLNTFGYYCFVLININCKIAEKLGLTLTSGKIGHFFGKMIKETIKLRDNSKTKRNDFIDLLLQLRDKGVIEVQSKDPEDSYLELDYIPPPETFRITEPILISQAYTFLTAGFDGLSSPMACIMYELAKHQDIQERVRSDVNDQIQKHGSLTYEALKAAKYLDCVINEGLRIYPLSKFILRLCNKDYEIEPGVKIEAGTKVIISNSATQMDPDLFPNPQEFDPSRFEGEITHTITDYSYLPFGAGPRMCIGMRFAQLIMKLGLATLLINYRFYLNAQSPSHLTMKVKTFFVNQPADHLLFRAKKIK